MTKFPRFKKYLLRSALMVAIALPCAWWFENWRGAKAWERAKADAEEKGVLLKRSDFLPPEIPDEENLLLNPIFAKEFENVGEGKLTGWRGLFPSVYPMPDLDPRTGRTVAFSSFFEEELSEDEARARFAAKVKEFEERLEAVSKVLLAMPRQSVVTRKMIDCPVYGDHHQLFGNLGGMAQCSLASGVLSLRSGDLDVAIQQITTLDRLMVAASGPSLLNILFETNIMETMIDLIWEGLRLQKWTVDQLSELAELLARLDLQAGFLRAIEYELAWGLEAIDWADQGHSMIEEGDGASSFGHWWYFEGPSGWGGQRRAIFMRENLFFREIMKTYDMERLVEAEPDLHSGWSPFYYASIGPWLSLPGFCQHAAGKETKLRMARIAIELERHFLKHQSYPATLESIGVPIEDVTDPETKDLVFTLGPGGRPVLESPHQKEKGPKLRWQYDPEEPVN